MTVLITILIPNMNCLQKEAHDTYTASKCIHVTVLVINLNQLLVINLFNLQIFNMNYKNIFYFIRAHEFKGDNKLFESIETL